MNYLFEEAAKITMAKIEAENRAEEKKRPAPKPEDVKREAAFLLRWSKGKPISRLSDSSTFWKCGKFMTKIDYKMAIALHSLGFATLSGDPMKRNATLVFKK